MSNGGKGSRPRPFLVDRKTFNDNWDRIFNNDNKQLEADNANVRVHQQDNRRRISESNEDC